MENVQPIASVLDARKYVSDWFDLRVSLTTVKKIASNPNSFGALFLDYEADLRHYFVRNSDKKKVRGLSKDSLMFAFAEYLHDAQSRSLEEHMAEYVCTAPTLEPLKAWVFAVTGKNNPVDLVVMAQWLWLVKRKGMGLKARYHIMPVLYGAQGAGKSEALKSLFAPMAEFQLNLPMNDIGDPRQFEGMSNNLVVFYDELSGIQRTDLNALKNQITTDLNSYRKLSTHITVSVPQACSFIAATNKHLDEQFTDSTGARRFYELEAMPKIDWEAVNAIDYDAMWRGIDERNAVGYLTGELLEKLTTAQQGLVTAEDIEMYMQDRNYSGDASRVITAKQAYQDYRIWCVESGVRSELSLGWFVKKLKNRGVETYTERDEARQQHRFFKVDKDCTVQLDRGTAKVTPLKWSN